MDAVIVVVAQYFFLISVAATLLVWLRQPADRKWAMGVAIVGGGLLAFGLITLAGRLHHDRRPFVIEHIRPLFAHPADNGFPSDHAALTMFLAVCVLFFAWRWGVALLVNAVLVGTARVLAHVHSPLDILAGFAIGAIAAALACWLLPKLTRRIPVASARPPAGSRQGLAPVTEASPDRR